MAEAPLLLTTAEILWLRRRRMGMRQLEWAEATRDTVHSVRDQEHGVKPAPPYVQLPSLTDGEFCAIVRRRLGWTMQDAARNIGLSRMTVWKAEHDRTAGVARVKAWYVVQGYVQAAATPSERANAG